MPDNRGSSRLVRSWPVMMIFAALGILASWSSQPETRGERNDPSPVRAQITALTPQADPRLVGVSSCASTHCHGGLEIQADDSQRWKSAYSVWARRDPHARAFEALFSARSKEIVARMQESSTDKITHRVFVEQHCAGCHGLSSASSEHNFAGVSCEACHGPARDWYEPHTSPGWDRSAQSGEIDTRELRQRAQACVGCHVGAPPEREVDHDLIAAGHPRLMFEFSSYFASLPRHWSEAADRKRIESAGVNFEAAAWEAGQVASADASLRQLEHRAATAPGRPWPEFTEYDCFACHHDLQPDNFRQFRVGRRGMSRWGTWYFALADVLPFAPLEPLCREMSKPRPDPAQVLQLLPEDDAVPNGRPLAGSPEWVARVAGALGESDAPFRNWCAAAQWLCAVRALGAGLANRTAFDTSLQMLCVKLAFPADEQKPNRVRFDSPQQFDPRDSEYRDIVEDLRRQLREMNTRP